MVQSAVGDERQRNKCNFFKDFLIIKIAKMIAHLCAVDYTLAFLQERDKFK